MSENVKVLIAGGGTAGHTNPGIAVAKALVDAGLDAATIRFAGSERGNESVLVPEAGFQIDVLPGRGIARQISKTSLMAVIANFKGLAKSLSLVRRLDPDVVVCLGGYAAFGPSVAAVIQRIPLVITEQNARASAVNRVLGRFAKVCALPYPDTDLPNGVLTGNPIRPEVVEAVQRAEWSEARQRLQIPTDRIVLAVWAGSLGATSVNNATRDLAERWKHRDDLAIYHVVGRRDWPEFSANPPDVGEFGISYQAVEYENSMPDLLAAADFALTRAGASTTAELAVAGLPALMVPLPIAPRDHQRANAQELLNAGGGLVISDSVLNAPGIEALLGPILADNDKIDAMASAAASVARPDAAAEVAALVLSAGGLQ